MSPSLFQPPLPIDAVLPELIGALRQHSGAVVSAAPGAGKTTRVPLALLDEPWLEGRRIILLEPRRLAARAAAARMARTLGESTGDTIGLRMRLETRVSAKTRIEVVTEGVFTRMILDDPMLEGVGAVVFDEFHERSLDGDFGLALALETQSALRENLRLLVMSATIDDARVSRLIGDAPVIVSEGRMFPVETRYLGRNPRNSIEDDVTGATLTALREQAGSILVFLPGQAEIRRVEERLNEHVRDPSVEVLPLYGALPPEEQERAIQPAAPGLRKVVLTTAIAETSLTIEGVRVVIDSGLARLPEYQPSVGITRLKTVKVSRASADQRRGRAGRLEPGVCYRLWEEAANGSFPAYAPPEILAADLSSFMLDCAAWGIRDPATLPLPDPPPAAALNEARALLKTLGALDDSGAITASGRRLRELPLPVRLARMVLEAAGDGRAREAAELAAVLVERGADGGGVDLAGRVERFRGESSARARDVRRLAASWAKSAERGRTAAHRAGLDWGVLLARAYPERLAKKRGAPGEFLMANGRAGKLDPWDALAREPFLVVADIGGTAASGRILAAAAIAGENLEHAFGDAMRQTAETRFDPVSRSLKTRVFRRIHGLVIDEQTRPTPATAESTALLIDGIRSLGLESLPWSDAARQWRRRVAFARRHSGGDWPDVSDDALLNTMDRWLAPYLPGKTSVDAIGAADLSQALAALLTYSQKKTLDELAPTHFTAPTGSRLPIDYSADEPNVSVRVQELFGLREHPAVAAGRVKLVLQLLSPAHRPIQITRDLPGFWRGSWAEVKSDMKGRYPKHPWPDDPASAPPTRRAKKKGQ
ncbi:MAG: ATP-dependent helicase HrpB [Methylobacteriaceae bacterium]|nr:ATP-dependent helicase HrpB [Methylobacteriaceae bacterium]